MKWTTYKLGDCVKFLSGGTPSKGKSEYWGGTIPWISCKDMKFDYLYDSQDHLSDIGITNGTRLVPNDTILIVVRGMILAQHFPVALTKRKVAFNQDLKALECSSSVFPRFLFHWLRGKSYEILGMADEAAHGTKRLQSDRLQNFPIDLPPLPTQRKIASILSAYDDLIENNTRRIKILEDMAQSLYQEWFVKFRFPGYEQVKMVESALGLIPEGWKIKKTTDAILINPKTHVSKEGDKAFVSMGCLSTNSMLITDFESRSGNSGSKFKNGDTLFARITPCLENGKTGYVQFLPSNNAVAFGSTEFIVLRSRTLCPEYIYLMTRSDAFRDNAIKSMTGASGRQRVQEACFDSFLFAHPDDTTITNFSKIVSLLFHQVYVLAQKNNNLRQTRDLLLPKLISGEINVENLNIDTTEIAA